MALTQQADYETSAPLVPRTLAAVLGRQSVPAWLCSELGLPDDSIVEVLAEGFSSGRVSARANLYILRLLETRRADVRDIQVVGRPWPAELDPETVSWTARARTGLVRAGLLQDKLRFGHVTYGELLAIPQMGARSVLEVARTAEVAVDRASRGVTLSADAEQMLEEMAKAPWAGLVSGEDPRFSDLLDPNSGQLLHQLDELRPRGPNPTIFEANAQHLALVLPAIRDRVAKIEESYLEDALSELVAALSGLTGQRLQALLRRYGFTGEPPWTLQRVADVLGVSRERVRQLQSAVSMRLPSHPLMMPALDRALELIAETSPASPRHVAATLRREGLTEIDFHPASVLSAASFCRRPATFEIENTPKGERVVTTPMLALAARINLVASRQSDSSGASNVAELVSALASELPVITEEHARETLVQYADAVFLDEDWFWIPNPSRNRNRLHNVARRILSVASPLDVAAIRDGARRAYRFRDAPLLPPRSVMAAFFEAHPDFIVQPDRRVAPLDPLDYRVELGGTEQILVDVLRAAPTSVLDRASFQEGCEARGMNRNTFTVYTTYSPVLEHLGTDLWALRGVDVNPAAVDALRRANSSRPRERVVEDYGWDEDGVLWVAARVPRRRSSAVIGLPSPIAHYVADRRFAARAEDGSAAGTIAVNAEGVSWGYTPFLNRRGGDEGDLLRIDFDLVGDQVTLRLGDYHPDQGARSGDSIHPSAGNRTK